MSELAHIQLLDPLRHEIAERMAAFEAANGPIETLPIRVGDPERKDWLGHPDAVEQRKNKSLQSVGKSLAHQRAMKVKKIREELEAGGTPDSAAFKAGVTRQYAVRLIREHGMQVK